jgi:glucosamine--fructose-6-phosphate aminotransferase (isomerizing)
MLEEIRQQPSALERTFRSELKGIEKLRAIFAKNRPKFIILAARGTSDNAAQFGRYLLEIATGIPVSLAAPSIFTLYGARVDYKDALVVAISQSGESTDTNLVLERARECGAFTVGVTNEASSTTKTYTGQLLAMYMLAYALGAPVSLDELRAMPEAVAGALTLESEIREKAGRYRFMENAVVVGRGLNYANAFECALKLMETCYVVAERFSSADFLHGPIAMVERSFPVFLFAPAGVTWPSIHEMIDRVHGLGAETLVITDQSNKEAVALKGTRSIVLPGSLHRKDAVPEELYTPLPYIVPAQILAACLAEEKGLNPDQPRALSKVTRTL